ncbi:hypothetical protein Angca_003247 [Angiostrongylus cantonensis]|nr:hypothetical protein Angca_003247 [Angiostrongylus cantonensis]
MDSKILLIFVHLFGLPSVCGIFGIGRLQSVGVEGKLCCQKIPAKNLTVSLYDDEWFYDALLNRTRTNDQGMFIFVGSKREITSLEPYVEIIHQCNVTKGCEETVTIKVPPPYVFMGPRLESNYKIKLDLAKHTMSKKLNCRK